MYDVLITGGTVVDGTGAPAVRADVAVVGGRIVAIGPDLGDKVEAVETIDATGRVVTPGFVDIHTHYDGQVTWDDLVEPTSSHGVTTIVLGNCGVGFAPVRPSDHRELIDLMEGVEDIPGAALSEGMTWGWESFSEYLDLLGSRRFTVDVGTQIAHGPVRQYVMGRQGAEDLAVTPEQIDAMVRIVREAIEAGAYGFSTSRTLGHRAIDGTPVPGTYASEAELGALGHAVAAGGGRVLEFAAAGLARNDDPQQVYDEFQWLGRIASETGLPTTFILLQPNDAPDRWRYELEQARTWRSQGIPVVPLIAGRSSGVLYGWDVRHPFMFREPFRAIADLPLADKLVELRKPSVRAAILAAPDDPHSPHEHKQLRFMRAVLPVSYFLTGVPDYEQPFEQQIGPTAERLGRSMDVVVYDGLLQADDVMVLYPMYNYVSADHSALYEQLSDREAVVGLNDGGAHCAYISDASVPTYMLSHWVRDRRRGPKMELTEVVRRLTSQPAELYGMADRGRLAVGLRADVNVIDLDRVGIAVPRAVHDLPAGGTRLMQDATGYDLTMVAGAITRRCGVDTGARPGRLLRSS